MMYRVPVQRLIYVIFFLRGIVQHSEHYNYVFSSFISIFKVFFVLNLMQLPNCF